MKCTAVSLVGNGGSFSYTSFKWCELDSRRPSVDWYTLKLKSYELRLVLLKVS